MRTSMRQYAGPLRGAWMGVLFLVFAGVVGMHGLGSHGVTHGSAHGTSEQAASHLPSPSAGGHTSHSDPASTDPATAALLTVDPLSDADLVRGGSAVSSAGDALTTGGLVELCLAVLLIGLTATLMALTARVRSRGLPVRPPIRLVSLAATRDRDPPSLTRLCVRRC